MHSYTTQQIDEITKLYNSELNKELENIKIIGVQLLTEAQNILRNKVKETRPPSVIEYLISIFSQDKYNEIDKKSALVRQYNINYINTETEIKTMMYTKSLEMQIQIMERSGLFSDTHIEH